MQRAYILLKTCGNLSENIWGMLSNLEMSLMPWCSNGAPEERITLIRHVLSLEKNNIVKLKGNTSETLEIAIILIDYIHDVSK